MRMANCHPDRRHTAKGLCNSCYHTEHKKLNRARYREQGNKWQAEDRVKQAVYKRRSRYGDIANLAFVCADRCEACRTPFTSDRQKHVDHSHRRPRDDAFRGILCSGCNHALGNLQDSEERILGLWNYLERVGP